MSEHTNIAWADSTFNPWIGCTKVGPGCDGCYAEVLMDARYGRVKWGPGQPRSRTSNAYWRKPLAWNGQPFVECMECGWRGASRDAKLRDNCAGFDRDPGPMRICPDCDRPTLKDASRRVFCASLCDVFDNEVPEAWRYDLWDLIAETPHVTWMLLTKRISNAITMLPWSGEDAHPGAAPPPNVWIGATVVNQEEADRDIPKLLRVPAAVRFLSIEPMLEAIDLTRIPRIDHEHPHPSHYDLADIDWVIVGGESEQTGHRARPFNVEWARDIVRQCVAAVVPVFVKQLGSEPRGWCAWNAPEHIGADEAASLLANREDGECVNFEASEQVISCEQHGKRCVMFRDRAGADPSEWPADLRVREFPK